MIEILENVFFLKIYVWNVWWRGRAGWIRRRDNSMLATTGKFYERQWCLVIVFFPFFSNGRCRSSCGFRLEPRYTLNPLDLFSKDGGTCHPASKTSQTSKVVSTSWDGLVKLWDYRTQRLLNTFDEHDQCGVYSTAFAPVDGRFFVTTGGDAKLCLFARKNWLVAPKGRKIQWLSPQKMWKAAKILDSVIWMYIYINI